MDTKEQVEKIENIAKQAGSYLFANQGKISSQEADVESQKIILDKFKDMKSNYPILAEEELSGYNLLVKDDSTTDLPKDYWSIDPLDGSAVFDNNCPEYSVSIALIQNHQPVLAVIYQPVFKLLVSASKNNGAYMNGEGIKLKNKKEPKKWLVGLDMCKSVEDEFDQQVFLPLTKKFRYVRNFPGVASFVELLLGRTGLYVSDNVRNWDIAAGVLALQEAGGIAQQLDGKPLDWRLVRMPPIAAAAHADLLNELK